MSNDNTPKPKVKKLQINEESVQELSDAELEGVAGGMKKKGAGNCGDTSTRVLTTCTKVDTGTVVPSTETC